MDDSLNDYVNSEIVCTLAALGYIEGNDYYKGDDCLECLKDLIRFLRNDDATCSVRRQLGRSKVVEKDLIPILRSCTSDEQNILEVCIRLMVNLTQPAVICFKKVPNEKIESNHFLELTSHLQSYKEAFAEKEIMAVIGRELGRLLQLEWDNREEEDMLLIERVLLLLRNILHVPADPQAEKRTDEDATVHDQVLWNLHVNGLDDLILYIASSPDESQWCMHALEIISHMLREQKPDVLAKTAVQRTRKEQDEETRELEILFEREKAVRKRSSRNGVRHSNFGGTFCIEDLKALDDENKLLYHRPLQSVKKLSFDFGKNPRKKRKKEMHAKDQDAERRSTLSIRMFLKEFCCQFLEHSYNPLMHTVKVALKANKNKSEEHDESYFLWAMRFFMEFNRQNKFEVAYTSETLNVSIFHDVLLLQTEFFDKLLTDKESKVEWGRRLHLALRAYQGLFQHIAALQMSKDEAIRDSVKVIKENVFYQTEYREIFMIMLRKFDPRCQTRSFLRDLVGTFHIFLKLLEGHCKTKGHVIVQQKKRKAKRKKKRSIPKTETAAPITPEQAEEHWQEISADLSSVLQNEDGELPASVNPFDPVSEVPEEDQKTRCLSTIQQNIRERSFREALALLRAAREIWPNSSFGESDVDAEGEFMCFYEIFRMDLPVLDVTETDTIVEDDNEQTDPEEEEMEDVQVKETEFDFSDFLKKLVSPSILQPYSWLLSFYQENSCQTNHYIIKMLHRVAVDLKTPVMLFQLSLFVTFRKILSDPAVSKYKELVTFSKYILSKFFALLPNNPALCAEIVFWKNSKECYEISEGYGSFSQRQIKRSGHSWTYEEEEELKQLYEEFKDTEDLVENILNGISNEFRSRRQVVGKLITLGLVQNREILKKKPVNKNAWTEEEENELTNLFEEMKNSEDIVGGIMLALNNENRSRRQVINKLVALGLVQDKEVLKKKHANKNAWTEDEENELRNLYEEFKNGEDIVDGVMHSLSKNRSRRQIINQLVKLDIVQDRKTLRKKRSKSSRKKKSRSEYEDEENDHEEDGNHFEDETEEEETDEESDEHHLEGENELVNMLSMLRASDHADQLEWIKTRLKSAAHDREEDDDWEPLPLVTLTEESEFALRDKRFQKVLKKIGLAPPSNEQERYWRIPGDLSPDQLRKAVSDLEAKSLEGESLSIESKKANPKRQKLEELAVARKTSDKRGERSRKRKDRSCESMTGKERRERAKQWRMNLSDDGESSDSESLESRREEPDGQKGAKEAAPSTAHKKPKRKRVRMEESDESDEGIQREHVKENVGIAKNEKVEENGEIEENGETEENGEIHENGEVTGLLEDGGKGECSDDNTGRKRGRREEPEEGRQNSDEDIFDLPLIRTKRARHAVLDDGEEED